MNNNIRIAKELIRLAKSLIAGLYDDLPQAPQEVFDSGVLEKVKEWFKKQGVTDPIEYETLANGCFDKNGYKGETCTLCNCNEQTLDDIKKYGIRGYTEVLVEDYYKRVKDKITKK